MQEPITKTDPKEYAKKIHGGMRKAYSGFSMNEQDFVEKMNSDPEYAKKIHGGMSKAYSGFSVDEAEFTSRFKKKDDTGQDSSQPVAVDGAPSEKSGQDTPKLGVAPDPVADMQAQVDEDLKPKKSDSAIENLTMGFKKTVEADLPSALMYQSVAMERTRSNAINTLEAYKNQTEEEKLNPNIGQIEGLENIDVEVATKMKAAIDVSVKKRTKLENDKSKLEAILKKGGQVNLGERQYTNLPTDKLKSEIKDLEKQIAAVQDVEDEQNSEWDSYMAPVLKHTGEGAASLAKKAKSLQEFGEKEYGSKLKMSTKDVDDFGDAVDYLAAQVGLSGGYMPLAVATAGLGMIPMEQGSIEGEMLGGLMEQTGMSMDELFASGLDQQGAEIALEEGIKAGALEMVGEGVSLVLPWATGNVSVF
jgi:hypothetical protein